MLGTIGFLLGWPLDIRHVTFSAANDAYARVAAGVLAIGGVNLLVSFSLALFTAMKARRVRFGYSRPLLDRIVRRRLRRPGDFVLPPAAGREDAGNTAV